MGSILFFTQAETLANQARTAETQEDFATATAQYVDSVESLKNSAVAASPRAK
jgi:hypothetical protein